MIQVTQKQRDNAIEARDRMWPTIKPEQVVQDLHTFRLQRDGKSVRAKPTCGTLACFGGWVPHWPAFREQGVCTNSQGMPKMKGDSGSNSAFHFTEIVAYTLFGTPHLFSPRLRVTTVKLGNCDDGFTGTDHELVTHRLNWLIENSEVAA